MRDRFRQGVAIVLLCGLFLGVMVHYGAAAPGHEQARQSVTKLQSPRDHAGESVYFWATVEHAGDAPVVRVREGMRRSLVGTDLAASPGDSVQVYGTIRADGSVEATRVVVSEKGALSRLYAVSVVALALTVAAFFRCWSVDGLAFVPRDGGEGGGSDA